MMSLEYTYNGLIQEARNLLHQLNYGIIDDELYLINKFLTFVVEYKNFTKNDIEIDNIYDLCLFFEKK